MLEKRDAVLRAYFEGRDWDRNDEFMLVKRLVFDPPPVLERYKYVFDYEWEVVPGATNLGKGDLVLAAGEYEFAVIEVKFIAGDTGPTARKRRNKKRNDVKAQARNYAIEFAKQHPVAHVLAVAYTNESGPMVIGQVKPSS